MKISTRTTHSTTVTLVDGTELDLELEFKPDIVMDYYEMLMAEVDDKVLIGYLVHDDDCEDPLEGGSTYGHIYDCRRHSRTLSDYEKALGLADGGPDLALIEESDIVAEALKRIYEDPKLMADALEHCREYWEQADGCTDEKFVRDCLDSINELTPVLDVAAINLEMWNAGRRNGTIGNPHAVLLDVYEHSGISYNVSGRGMQCLWDTARGGAVWVPDSCCLDEIRSRGEVYRKGKIFHEGRKDYNVRTWESFDLFDKRTHPTFKHWHEAYEYLKTVSTTYEQPLADAEHDAAKELAQQACEVYTDWRNGNCYGVVVETFDREGTQIDCDHCWGFIGADDAYSSLANDYFHP